MTNFTGLVLGSKGNADQFWNGPIGEILFFSSKLSDISRQKVESYLAHKWGLQSNLGIDHPYNSLFSIDSNGTLTANQIFDYETELSNPEAQLDVLCLFRRKS